MYLQKFINENIDYTSLFRKLNINYKKYTELGLMIVTYKYNYNYDFNKYPFIKECKGTIIRLSDNKIISPSIIKASNNYNLSNHKDNINNNDIILQPLIDGTMINMFYHNNEWFISTRSYIGAKNKWDNISFKNMFDSIVKEKSIDFNQLNKNNSYSFVLVHKDNIIVSQVEDNNLILVQEYSPENSDFINLEDKTDTYKSFTIIKNNNPNVILDSLNKKFNYQFKGFTLKNKNDNTRINFINENYSYVKNLKDKGSFNNKLLSYLYYRNNNLLTEYLKYFKNDTNEFNKYRNLFYIFKNELYQNYVNLFIKKSIEKKNVPYQLKNHVFSLHEIYKTQNIKITNETVNNYLYSLPIKRLCFSLNYYLT